MTENYEFVEKTGISFQSFLSLFFLIIFIIYIFYHLYNGNYGLENYLNKEDIVTAKRVRISELEKNISNLENKIGNLQSENLDQDLLDEEIRKNIGYAKKNEIVIYVEHPQNTPEKENNL
jgi:cell division protein FtsB